MVIGKYIIGFIIFSFLGWVWETFYCMINSGHYENRGFLYGPYCPIYGVGAMLANLIFIDILFKDELHLFIVFIICMVGSAVLEYITSYVLEKVYHARWWDYSNVPLNIYGRIALPMSIAFGLAGVLLVRFILPIFNNVMPVYNSLIVELIAFILVAIISVDIGITLSTLSQVVNKLTALQEEFGDRVGWAYSKAASETEELKEQLESYSSYIKMRISQVGENIDFREVKMIKKMRHFTSKDNAFVAKKIYEISNNFRKENKRK